MGSKFWEADNTVIKNIIQKLFYDDRIPFPQTPCQKANSKNRLLFLFKRQPSKILAISGVAQMCKVGAEQARLLTFSVYPRFIAWNTAKVSK